MSSVTTEDIFSSYMSPWVRMDEKDWDPIIQDSILKTYPKNTTIYHQGEITSYLYLVKKGRVCLDVYGANGKQRSIYIADHGTCFGELSCLDQLPNYCTAVTRTQTCLYLISRQRFQEEIQKNSVFTMSLLRALSLKTRLITGLLEQMSFDNSKHRLYYSLVGLLQQYGTKTKEEYYQLNIKFTHQEMAYQTGLSRVSISNMFLDLTNKGLIDKTDGYLVFKDLNALQEYLLKEET